MTRAVACPLTRASSVYHPQFYPIHKHLFHHVVATATPRCIHAFINLDLRHDIFTGMLVGIKHDCAAPKTHHLCNDAGFSSPNELTDEKDCSIRRKLEGSALISPAGEEYLASTPSQILISLHLIVVIKIGPVSLVCLVPESPVIIHGSSKGARTMGVRWSMSDTNVWLDGDCCTCSNALPGTLVGLLYGWPLWSEDSPGCCWGGGVNGITHWHARDERRSSGNLMGDF